MLEPYAPTKHGAAHAFAAAGYRALYWDYQDGGFEWDVTICLRHPLRNGKVNTSARTAPLPSQRDSAGAS